MLKKPIKAKNSLCEMCAIELGGERGNIDGLCVYCHEAMENFPEDNGETEQSALWQPIETAPTDGSDVYIKGGVYDTPYSDKHGFINRETHLAVYCHKESSAGIYIWKIKDKSLCVRNPTHWSSHAPVLDV